MAAANPHAQADLRRGQDLLFAPIDHAASGNNNVIVAADSARKIKVVNYVIVADAAVTARWRSGPTALSGAMSFSANGGVAAAATAGSWLLETAIGADLKLDLGAAIGVRGHVGYFLERD